MTAGMEKPNWKEFTDVQHLVQCLVFQRGGSPVAGSQLLDIIPAMVDMCKLWLSLIDIFLLHEYEDLGAAGSAAFWVVGLDLL